MLDNDTSEAKGIPKAEVSANRPLLGSPLEQAMAADIDAL
jgi:hypothetical protein